MSQNAGWPWEAQLARDVLEASPDGVLLVEPSGKVVFVNAQAGRLFGYERQELAGQDLKALMPERYRQRHQGAAAAWFAAPRPRLWVTGLDLIGLRRDGSEFPAEILLSPLGDGEVQPLCLATVRDVSERTRRDGELAYFAAMVGSSADAIDGRSLDGTVVSWNAAAERLYGFASEEMVGTRAAPLAPPARDDDLAGALGRARAGEAVAGLETVQVRKDGTYVDVSLTVSPVRNKEGGIIGTSAIARDIISQLVRYRDQLRYLADHDPLTGASSRRAFERDLSEQVGRVERYGEWAVVMVVDVDGFKAVNDRFGHQAGDPALRAVSDALRRRLRKTDVVARLGGDEFGLLLPYAGLDEAGTVAAGLRRAVSEIELEVGEGARLSLSVTIGSAVLAGGTTAGDALLAADRAMYQGKPAVLSPPG